MGSEQRRKLQQTGIPGGMWTHAECRNVIGSVLALRGAWVQTQGEDGGACEHMRNVIWGILESMWTHAERRNIIGGAWVRAENPRRIWRSMWTHAECQWRILESMWTHADWRLSVRSWGWEMGVGRYGGWIRGRWSSRRCEI